MTEFKDTLTYWQVKEKIEGIPNLQWKALACCMYGFACRISELSGNKKLGRQGLTKPELWIEERHNKHLLKASLWNEKQSEPAAKKIAMISIERESWLTQPIIDWKEQCTTERLFPYSRTWLFLHIKALVKFNPHYFRKARATHYLSGQVTGQPESLEAVRQMGGWTSKRTMIEHYSQVSTIDVERMV